MTEEEAKKIVAKYRKIQSLPMNFNDINLKKHYKKEETKITERLCKVEKAWGIVKNEMHDIYEEDGVSNIDSDIIRHDLENDL